GICSSLAPRLDRKSLAAKHQPFRRHNTSSICLESHPPVPGASLCVRASQARGRETESERAGIIPPPCRVRFVPAGAGPCSDRILRAEHLLTTPPCPETAHPAARGVPLAR